MAKGDFRFIINTGWPPEHEFSVIFSAAKDFYGRDFTQKRIQALFTLLKPLGLAILGKSTSEVMAAIAEAKEKNQLLYECAITIANAKHQPDPQSVPSLMSALELGESESRNGKAHRATDPKSVDSISDGDLFGAFDDD
ncbi:hypothetical protein ACSYAD_30705 [Acaryochloris marina NIES-2412]|uniref:hypothetical protein n=1 Tax=Acaryochloris marina TaxID=155978 RepID=UPI004057E0F7